MLVLVAVLLCGGGACGGAVVVLGFGRAVGLLFGGGAFGGAGNSRVRKWFGGSVAVHVVVPVVVFGVGLPLQGAGP